MSSISSDQISTLVTARRLMIHAKEMEAERNGKKVTHQSAKEAMEEDQALISGQAFEAQKTSESAAAAPQTDGVEFNFTSLATKLHQVQAQPADPAAVQAQQTSLEIIQKEEIQVRIQYARLEKVDGLVVRDQNSAETDRYAFDFRDGLSLKIVDKWSGKFTRVWGDPHVDTSDQEGELNGEFSDLKGSNSQTTLMLLDGSRVTFTAKDNGLIEKVDIFKGSQHLGGIGAGEKEYTAETGMFAAAVDSSTSASSVPTGDTVFAGGDGADWFDSAGKLVWGKTTGPAVTSRPDYTLEMSYRRTLTSQVTISSVTAQA